MKKIKSLWCKNCLNMSTRPRITFDNRGWCNACLWAEEKKTFDWSKREKKLIEIIEENKSNNGGYDCIVPVSGGKMVICFTNLKKYGINPLTVTIAVLEMDLGKKISKLY